MEYSPFSPRHICHIFLHICQAWFNPFQFMVLIRALHSTSTHSGYTLGMLVPRVCLHQISLRKINHSKKTLIPFPRYNCRDIRLYNCIINFSIGSSENQCHELGGDWLTRHNVSVPPRSLSPPLHKNTNSAFSVRVRRKKFRLLSDRIGSDRIRKNRRYTYGVFTG